MSNELMSLGPDPDEIDPTDSVPRHDDPIDLRPDLSRIGIVEIEKGVCEDTYENRQLLRRNEFNWDAVYDNSGRPTGLIAARSIESSRERRLLSLVEKKPLLSEPNNTNSDFLTGVDLMADDAAYKLCPPWVVGATRAWIKEQEQGGPKSSKRAPLGLPARCRIVKPDGIRCQLWFSGRIKDDGLCRIHLKTIRRPGADVERARLKLIQGAPYAVDKLEQLMETAVSEPVALKAATEILDRAGVRGGTELDVGIDVTDSRPAHVIVAERLQRLAQGATMIAGALGDQHRVIDAEIVVTEDSESTDEKKDKTD
jgi:hypothetical protein